VEIAIKRKRKTMCTVTTIMNLSELAKRIDAEHRECERSLKAGLEHALKAGQLLLEAKATVGHGEWLSWLEKNCHVPERLAQKYMRVARELPKLDAANTPRVADLSFRQALEELASNAKTIAKLAEHDKAEALERAEQQTMPMRRIVKGMKQEQNRAEANDCIRWPDGDLPRGTDRPITVNRVTEGSISSVSDIGHMWKIRLGLNESGRRFPDLVDAERKKPQFLARLSATEELKRRSKELKAESERLERLALEQHWQICRDIGAEIEAEHGPCFPYVNWEILEVSPEVQKTLEAAATDEERFSLLQASRHTKQSLRWITRGLNGDFRLFNYTPKRI
jgi:hypothetical protein